MAEWKELLYKEHLTYAELRQIPGASCENYIAMKNYFVKYCGYTEEELLRGLSMSKEDFNNPKNWINSHDEQLFHINVFKHSRSVFTIYDYVEAGRFFQFSDNSLFMIFFKALSAGKIIREIERNINKFNNEYTIKPIYVSAGNAYLIQKDYPFYNEVGVGGECRFTEGVWKANFEIHDITDYKVEQLICSRKLQNILTYGYGHLGLEMTEDDNFIYVNGKVLGEKVELKSVKIENIPVFINEVIPGGTNKNGILIVEDLKVQDKTLIKKGDIFNAPYCLFHLTWKEHSPLIRIFNAVKGRNLLLKSLNEIEKQIEFTNLQLFELRQTLAESDRRIRIMEIYTRNSLVEKIKNGEDPTIFLPEEKKMAVLFNDIREFTTLAERLKAIDVVYFLNNYFNNVNEVINTYNGEIDKLIGDCVMAGFMDPDSAVKAGISIKRKIGIFNRELAKEGKETINTGIGITYGNVIMGNIGSASKLDYTLIGDTVNVASRLENITKNYLVGYLISEDLYKLLTGSYNIRFVDRVKLKGRESPINIYEVFDYEKDSVKEFKHSIDKRLEEAYDCYIKCDFTNAISIYNEILSKMNKHSYKPDFPADPLIQFYLKRTILIKQKYDDQAITKENWDGVTNFYE